MTNRKQNRIKRRLIKINRTLLGAGMDNNTIMEFWEDCMAEAEIQHQLPQCNCPDTSWCDTWCRAKAHFVMNPPEE